MIDNSHLRSFSDTVPGLLLGGPQEATGDLRPIPLLVRSSGRVDPFAVYARTEEDRSDGREDWCMRPIICLRKATTQQLSSTQVNVKEKAARNS